MNYEIDLELLRNNNITDREARAKVLEDYLKELSIKYDFQYAFTEDRAVRSKERVYIADDTTTIIFTFTCDECVYEYLMYLFKTKMDSIEKAYKSYNKE